MITERQLDSRRFAYNNSLALRSVEAFEISIRIESISRMSAALRVPLWVKSDLHQPPAATSGSDGLKETSSRMAGSIVWERSRETHGLCPLRAGGPLQ
jgi:hypothetical protein